MSENQDQPSRRIRRSLRQYVSNDNKPTQPYLDNDWSDLTETWTAETESVQLDQSLPELGCLSPSAVSTFTHPGVREHGGQGISWDLHRPTTSESTQCLEDSCKPTTTPIQSPIARCVREHGGQGISWDLHRPTTSESTQCLEDSCKPTTTPIQSPIARCVREHGGQGISWDLHRPTTSESTQCLEDSCKPTTTPIQSPIARCVREHGGQGISWDLHRPTTSESTQFLEDSCKPTTTPIQSPIARYAQDCCSSSHDGSGTSHGLAESTSTLVLDVFCPSLTPDFPPNLATGQDHKRHQDRITGSPSQHHSDSIAETAPCHLCELTTTFNEIVPEFSWIASANDHDTDAPPVVDRDLNLKSFICEGITAEIPDDPVAAEVSGHHDEAAVGKSVPLYDGAPINIGESLAAVLSFAQSEKISGVGLQRLLSLINLHLPPRNNFFQSVYQLYRIWDHKDDQPVQSHYFCSICYKRRESDTDLCDVCTSETRFVHYFLSLPLVPQLQRLYKRAGFVDDIQHKSRRVKQNSNNIEDIYDSQLYKEAEQTVLGVETNISFMWNTDGVQVFNSSSYSLWPFYLVINELPPEKRFRSENMIIVGLWGSITKPHPNVFLQPIFNDLKTVEDGIDVQFYGDDRTHKIYGKLLCGTCDAPARATFLNMKSHSGFYSCHKCKCIGEKSERTSNVTVFPYSEDVSMRRKAEYPQQVKWAVENNVLLHPDLLNDEACCGIKGPTLLAYLVPDLFSSTAIDSMHNCYMGVMKYMLHLWFDQCNNTEDFSIHSKMHSVNVRLKRITPPHFIQRRPQGIDKLVYWHASEFRSFLFNLGLCVLNGVLKEKYFDHFVLFVGGVARLNSSSISFEDIQISKLLLCQFVQQFADLYGLRHMTHNIHMLQHLSDCVQTIGPLWATSCFQYEDMNGRLTRLIHGTRHVGLQIYSQLSVIRDLPLVIHRMTESPVKEYCLKLHHKWMQLRISSKVSKGIYLIGLESSLSDDTQWILHVLEGQGVIKPSVSTVSLFHRLLKNGILYVSNSYDRGLCCSSYVNYSLLNSVKYGKIEYFVKVKTCKCVACSCSKKHLAIIRTLQPEVSFITNNVSIKHVLKCSAEGDNVIDVVDVDALQTVMYKVQIFQDQFYLCEPLNKFEME